MKLISKLKLGGHCLERSHQQQSKPKVCSPTSTPKFPAMGYYDDKFDTLHQTVRMYMGLQN